MKKYYKYGEMLLTLREEYRECKYLLDELNKYINVKSDNNHFYFTGLLSDDDSSKELDGRRIRLFIEKRYLNILKKIEYFKYNWYCQYLYSAFFNVKKEENGLYGLEYDNIFTPVDGRKYIPEVQIVNQAKFSELIDKLFSSDLMQLKKGYFSNNHDSISLDFDMGFISTSLGDDSFIGWNSINDNLDYSITRHNSPVLIEEILSLEIPSDKISPEWLKLLEKHESIFERELLFDVDINAQSKKGILQFSDIQRNSNNNVVKLLKKQNNRKIKI